MSEVSGSRSLTEQPNQWQVINEATHHLINRGNLLDYSAIVTAYVSAPHFDSWPGIVGGLFAFGTDGIDGAVARHDGTVTAFGAGLDAVGDKVKIAWAFKNIWQNDQAPKSLLVAVAVPNIINATLTGVDRAINSKPHFEVGQSGKDFMKYTVPAVGVNVIGNKIAEKRPVLGSLIKIGATAVGFWGVLERGVDSSSEYLKVVKNGQRRPWVKKVIALASKVENSISTTG